MAIQLNTSSLHRQFSSLLKRRKCATVTFCPMRCESCNHVKNIINKGAQVRALTSWVGLTKPAVLPASSTACQQKGTAVLARWSLTPTILYSYSVNQHFPSSLLLCSSDSITLETKGDNHLSMIPPLLPTTWETSILSTGERQLINTLIPCVPAPFCDPFHLWNKVALGWGSSICYSPPN